MRVKICRHVSAHHIQPASYIGLMLVEIGSETENQIVPERSRLMLAVEDTGYIPAQPSSHLLFLHVHHEAVAIVIVPLLLIEPRHGSPRISAQILRYSAHHVSIGFSVGHKTRSPGRDRVDLGSLLELSSLYARFIVCCVRPLHPSAGRVDMPIPWCCAQFPCWSSFKSVARASARLSFVSSVLPNSGRRNHGHFDVLPRYSCPR